MARDLLLIGIGLRFGAIQRHMTQIQHPYFLEQPQDLKEQAIEGIKVAAQNALIY